MHHQKLSIRAAFREITFTTTNSGQPKLTYTAFHFKTKENSEDDQRRLHKLHCFVQIVRCSLRYSR